VTGASGYVGGRLVPRLLESGHQVRCCVRRPEALPAGRWQGAVEVVAGDARDPVAMRKAMQGVEVVYYLVHSLYSGPSFRQVDAECARVTREAAQGAGVARLVYLGGPAPPASDRSPSPHLASRAEVAQILADGPVPTVTLRAAVILGSGSVSFEMLRYLTERLPLMVTPKWVSSRVQPIAIRDVLDYLVRVLELSPDLNRTFDLGGPEVLTYEEMMQRYAAVAGLPRRVVLRVPWLSLGLSAAWVNLVTPVPARIARPLIESLRHDAVAQEHDIEGLIGPPKIGVEEAIALAIRRVRDREVPTRWSDATWPARGRLGGLQIGDGGLTSGALEGEDPSVANSLDPPWAGGTIYVDRRVKEVRAPADALYKLVEGIGGERGWYSCRLAWYLRGLADRTTGGVGLRRGRRDPDRLKVGDAVDFWRVEELEQGRRLVLAAEMRLPGAAWLVFDIEETGPGSSRLVQQAVFRPRGLSGHLYWWLISPFHQVVFAEMAANLARSAERSLVVGASSSRA
jgi:uncharacterized protein YbjT (DUF2867 family)